VPLASAPPQIQAPSAKSGIVQTQWLPKYYKRENAALAYDVANTWRVIKGVAGVTAETVSGRLGEGGHPDQHCS